MGQKEDLRGLLTKKKDLLCEIGEETREQAALLQTQDIEQLLKNLEARQERIDAIEAIDAQIVRLVDGKGTATEKMGVVHRMFPGICGEITALLQAITGQDKENGAAAAGILEEYQARIREAGQTRKTAGGYMAAQDFGEGIYFDSKK